MSNEELATTIQHTNDTALYHELWQQVERFVAMQASKAHRQLDDPRIEFDDLYNAGYIAMVKAADTFSADKGASFVSWLSLYLRTAFAIVGGYRSDKDKKSPLRYAASLDTPLGDTDDFTLGDTIADDTDAYEDAEQRIWCEHLRAQLEKALEQLSDEQRDVIYCRYFRSMTLSQTGGVIGEQPEDARRIEAKALRRLRRPQSANLLRDFVEEHTNYYRNVGVKAFNTTGDRGVELETMYREQLEGWYKANVGVG